MAKIAPLNGLRYDPQRAGSPVGTLMAPPYDVVDAARREALAAGSDHNCIHFILPEGAGDEKYPHGASRFRAAIEAAMIEDGQPAFYVYHQRFEARGTTYTRKGFVGLIELTRFGHGPVLPHERTLAGPKADRLKLMRACQAHLELVFGMFSDPDRRWETEVDSALGEPVLNTDFEGIHHTLWRVTDPAAVAGLTSVLEDRKIYIADGHHRYETMCAFADELRAAGNPKADYGMIYLSNLDDPGLVVLPLHRLVHSLPSLEIEAVLRSVEAWFDTQVHELPPGADGVAELLGAAGQRGPSLGLCVAKSTKLHVLTLKTDFDAASAGLDKLAPALQGLDVVLLHELVLERALGITKAAQEAKANLRYVKSSETAHDVALRGDGKTQLVCFMNATPVADVRAVCDSGEVMPQKSTFFYPKIPNGLVFHDVRVSKG